MLREVDFSLKNALLFSAVHRNVANLLNVRHKMKRFRKLFLNNYLFFDDIASKEHQVTYKTRGETFL